MNKPVVVWSRAGFRIVAVDTESDDEMAPYLVLEELTRDNLGGDRWLPVTAEPHNEAPHMMLLLEIASRIEVVPSWVRDLVSANLEVLEDEAEELHGDAS